MYVSNYVQGTVHSEYNMVIIVVDTMTHVHTRVYMHTNAI
jgi:hypothetical protein